MIKLSYFWGKLAYFWFVVMLILVGFFSGNLEVKAETNQSYTSATYEVRQCKQRLNNGNYELYDCVSDSANFNEAIQFGSDNGHLKRIQYLIYNSNNYWNTGSYNIRLKVAIGYDFSFPELQEYRFVMYANENASSSGAQGGSNTKYIANYTCNVENDESTYDFYVNCTFNTKSPIKFIMIEMIKDYEAPGTINTDWIWWMQVSSFTASTDSTDAINNQTDILNDAINNTTNAIQGINDTLEDDSIDNPSGYISDFQSMLPTNGTITNLIALPINLYTKILNSINGTCSSFDLGSLYGTNLIMPCIDLSTYLGNTLWNLIDLMMSGFFILAIAKKMIKAFENFTSMREGDVIND